MNWNRFAPALCALALALTGGCKKSTPADQLSTLNSPPRPTSIHWLGMKRIAAQTNSAGFMAVWNLPETAKLKNQTLDKLAAWLNTQNGRKNLTTDSTDNADRAGGQKSGNRETNRVSILRPLLDDLVQEEWHLEIPAPDARPSTPPSPAWSLALRLTDQRAALWQTNLAQKSEVGGQRSEDGARLQVSKSGEWTIVTLAGPGADRNVRAPATQPATNFWLEVSAFPLSRFPLFLSPPPSLSLTLIGAPDASVRTRAQLDFPSALNLDLQPWNLPTNLVGQPLVGFTAMRGLGPWLAALKGWQDLGISVPPNQFCAWALEGLPTLTYFAAPQPDASNCVARLTQLVLDAQERLPWLATNDYVKFARSEETGGLRWSAIPFISPFLQSTQANGSGFVFAGLSPLEPVTGLPPDELFRQIQDPTNLVFYGWELTGLAAELQHPMLQLARLAGGKAQLLNDVQSRAWLLAAQSKLGNCVTLVTQTAPNQLSLTRKSTIGLSAIELQVLADWLESATFPRSLHTFTAPPE